eukprot:TRINITY_DN27739_c0_g3_i1.p1 TRINITY_DN27739_c0_g3~~TRINITY_DN27739_c0_g3_i1.p1  ORF type:complete len:733 (-),score=141.42 TRINITY_DN27739_c0_g3_i1:66-2264(-)
MTVLSGVAMQGSTAIFDLVANFLDRCNFHAAAHAIKTQCSEREPLLEAGLLKSFREHVDGCAMLLAELEAAARPHVTPRETAVNQLLDNLLRSISSGQIFSDERLLTCIDGALKSDAFPKLALSDIVVDRKSLDITAELFGTEDGNTYRFWEGIQKEFQASAENRSMEPSQEAAAAAVPAEPPEPSSSSSYKPKRRGAETHEIWDIDDEYHDDDDPGYRIREIYEAELLAELAHKMQPLSPTATTAEPVADELATAAAEQGAVPDIGTQETQRATEVLSSNAGEKEPARSSSPTFGGGAPETEKIEEVGTRPIAAAEAGSLPPGGPLTENAQVQQETFKHVPSVGSSPAAETGKPWQQRKDLKYAASGDRFYPVELNGVIYDSFNLRMVFERDKTGFEESKEFPILTDTVVAARYQIVEYLGSAAFSRAVQCLDLDSNKMVCMKIIKNDKDFFDQSLDEIKLLKYINVNGDVDENCVLRLYDHFYHKEHLIIVTELLRDNLYEFSKYNRESGEQPYFTIGRLQKISKQILTALEYVHSLRLIHCDLKPENILIKSYSRCEVKVIDFGSSCFVDDHLSSYVQSRSYRAPEVMLGLPYDQKIDLWSLGCIIAELWTGYVLFQNDSVQSLLARILGILGTFPYHLMTRGKYVPQYFTQDGQLYQEIEGSPCPERGRRLHLLVPKKSSLRQRMRTDNEAFLDFLEQLLQLDPTKRPTASEALRHPFLQPGQYPDGL